MTVNYWHTFEEGGIYHIYNHAASNRNLFKEPQDYFRFLEKYSQYFNTIFKTYAYCLMPNHFHLLIQINNVREIRELLKTDSNATIDFAAQDTDLNGLIIDQMRRWFSGYALYYNKKYNIRGQLFLKKAKRVSIDEELKLKYLVKYIHHNPIHHGFTESFNLWPYSSYNDVIQGNKNSIIAHDYIVTQFGNIDSFYEEHESFKIDYKEAFNIDS